MESSITHLVTVCASSKKIVVSAVLEALFQVALLVPANKSIGMLVQAMEGKKSPGLRAKLWGTIQHVLSKLGPDNKSWEIIEQMLKGAVGDSSAEVRNVASDILHLFYQSNNALKIKHFYDKLDLASQKQLLMVIQKKKFDWNLHSVGENETKSDNEILDQLPPALFSLEDKVDVEGSDSEDDEIILPMKSIQIASDPKEDLGGDHSFPPSKLPRKLSGPQLAVSTPWARKQSHHDSQIPVSSHHQILVSIDHLISQIAITENGISPATLTKLLYLSRSNDPTLWTGIRVGSLIIGFSDVFDQFDRPFIEIVGLTVKHLLAFSFGEIGFDILFDLLSKLLPFESEFRDKWGSISEWIPLDSIDPGILLVMVESKPCVLSITLLARLIPSLNPLLLNRTAPILLVHWNAGASNSILLRRTIVECLVMTRRKMGDSAFFTLFPALTLPQRRLLDAFMTVIK